MDGCVAAWNKFTAPSATGAEIISPQIHTDFESSCIKSVLICVNLWWKTLRRKHLPTKIYPRLQKKIDLSFTPKQQDDIFAAVYQVN